MDEQTRQSGRSAQEEHREKLAEALDSTTEIETPEERERSFRTPGFSRLRTDWSGEDGRTMRMVHDKVSEVIDNTFMDLLIVRQRIFEDVAEPLVNPTTKEIKTDHNGLIMWRTDEYGEPRVDWSQMTHARREHYIYTIITKLFDWQERCDRLRAEAQMAKVTWEESFAEGWKEAAAEGRGTDASRNEGAKKNSIEERYFAVYVTYLSRRAESLVRGMERLEQRLKDLHTNQR